jgi:probable F420-dependent oxidoreductase
MPARPIRFAVQLVAAPDGPAWAALARSAEDSGFDVASLPDHLGEQFSPLPALTAAACATTKLRLSMFVLANDMRHPGLLAKEVATLDVLSGGRVELGLGAGWDAGEYQALGIPFDRPSVRIARLEESVRAIRALLAGEAVTHHGAHYQLADLVVRPRPVQPGGVPIVLGGGGRKMLALAGRLADVVSVATENNGRNDPTVLGPWVARQAVADQIAWVKESAGERFDRLELNLRVRMVAVDIGVDREAQARSAVEGMDCSADDLLGSPFALFGTVDEVADQLLRTRDELGLSYFTVSQRFMEQLAPVIERIAGR